MSYLTNIVDYYDRSQWQYGLFIYNNKSLGMHFGFWDKNTKNRFEAQLNENQEIIKLGKIKIGMKVLDAGCGVGGTAIYIVKKTGAKVYGITLSENQVKLAQKYAKKNQVSESVDFSVQNYNKTSFPNNCFDIVYGIESICHAYTKEKFLLEAKRILKPGGKLIIMDGYTSRKVKTKEEKEIIKKFTEGFVLKELIEVNKMTDLIRRTGFVKVRSINKIDAVIPSLEYFHKEMQKNKWLAKLLLLIPHPYFQTIIMNMQATENAYKGVKIGLATYYIHYAEKPHT